MSDNLLGLPLSQMPQPLDEPPRLVLLSGRAAKQADEPPIGIYDSVRADVRRMSSVQPVDQVFIERHDQGYRGVLYSKQKPYLFVLNGNGLLAKPSMLDDLRVRDFKEKLAEQERALTAEYREAQSMGEQERLNDMFVGPAARDGGFTATPEEGPAFTLKLHGPAEDMVERLPGARPLRIDTSPTYEGMAAGGVVLNADGKVLLVKPTGGYGGYDWTFPKGYLTRTEAAQATGPQLAALREVAEETGYECRLSRSLGVIEHNDGGLCHYYVMEDPKRSGEGDGEVAETKWASVAEALDLLNDDKDVEVLLLASVQQPKLLLKGNHTGMMIACFVPKNVAAKVAIDGGEPVDELHVTLAYLGKGLSEADQKKVVDVVRKLSEVTPPLVGKLAGIGRFSASGTSEGKDVIYLSVDSPALTRFRPLLVDAINSVGISVSESHGYTPHVTLAYIDTTADSPLKRVEPVDVTFTHLAAAAGPKKFAFPMRTRMTLKKARNVKQPGKHGAHFRFDDAGNVRYDEPGEQKPKREFKAKPKAVKIGEKPLYVHTNAMGMQFLRKKSQHNESDFDTPARRAQRFHMEGVTEGEVDLWFTTLRDASEKTMDAFLEKQVKPLWDDEGGKNKYTPAKGREYLEKYLSYLEQDGAIAPGGRDLLNRRKLIDWKKLSAKLSNLDTSPTSQKYVREMLREILSHYGLTYKEQARAAKEKSSPDVIHVDGHLGRSRAASAYHSWDGRVAIKIEVLADLKKFVAHMASEKPGDIPMEQAKAFSVLLHEELHGCSNMEMLAYQGPGAVIEEVITEVSARTVMRDKLGHLPLSGLSGIGGSAGTVREHPMFNIFARVGSYGDYIADVRSAIAKQLVDDGVKDNVDEKAARLLEQAAFKMKQADVFRSKSPQDHVGTFVACVPGLSDTRRYKLGEEIKAMVARHLQP